MLGRENAAVEMDLRDVNGVRQQAAQGVDVDGTTTVLTADLRGPALQLPTSAAEFLDRLDQGAQFEEQVEGGPDPLRLGGVDDQPATVRMPVISQGQASA